MDSDIAKPVSQQPVRGYQRAAVEEFLAAANAEKARLEALIADANERAAVARTAVGMHHIMVAMLVETQEELTRRRREADLQAAEIIAAAEAQALAIERPTAMPEPAAVPAPAAAAPVVEGLRIHAPAATAEPVPASPRLEVEGHDDDEEADRFFAFLRRALSDEEPLGPRPEMPA